MQDGEINGTVLFVLIKIQFEENKIFKFRRYIKRFGTGRRYRNDPYVKTQNCSYSLSLKPNEGQSLITGSWFNPIVLRGM